ncbi:unnamed protein product [Euphydryas editha]|uniref:Endonuclease/exonuclease/phosphatase domain-containing protein n=1 Tax=Euphydryas editha TaxID=104508 RepID=A0AAU9V556_EUPED|nr:unnamed protein product [Euphydryas editha]
MNNSNKILKVKLLQWNAQSLRPKLSAFENILIQEKIHICILSEPWLEPSFSLKINAYNIYRLDRDDSYGGIAIVIHKSIKAQCNNVDLPNFHIQALHVKMFNCCFLENVVAIYCPPNKSSADITFATPDIDLRFDWSILNESLGSDHFMVLICTDMVLGTENCSIKRNYKKADWQKYKNILQEKLQNFNITGDILEIYDSAMKLINLAADKSIPIIKVYENPTSKFRPKPYWTAELSQAVSKRRRALAQLRKNPTPSNLINFRQKVSYAQKLLRKSISNSYHQFCDSISQVVTSGEMWKKNAMAQRLQE